LQIDEHSGELLGYSAALEEAHKADGMNPLVARIHAGLGFSAFTPVVAAGISDPEAASSALPSGHLKENGGTGGEGVHGSLIPNYLFVERPPNPDKRAEQPATPSDDGNSGDGWPGDGDAREVKKEEVHSPKAVWGSEYGTRDVATTAPAPRRECCSCCQAWRK